MSAEKDQRTLADIGAWLATVPSAELTEEEIDRVVAGIRREVTRLADLGHAVQDTYGIRTAEEWHEWLRRHGTHGRSR